MTGAVHVNPTSLADRAGSRSATHSVSPGALTPLSSCLSLRQARASSALVRAATSVSLCLEPVRYQSTAAPTAATRVEGSRHRSVVQIADVVDADKAAASVTDRLIAGESHPSRRFCQTLGVGRISGKLCSFVLVALRCCRPRAPGRSPQSSGPAWGAAAGFARLRARH